MADSQNLLILIKAFDVINLMAMRCKPMGVSEIGRELHLPKSVVFRILNTLKDKGFVSQDPQTRSYSLGIRFYYVGQSAQRMLPLCRTAAQVLDPLSVKLGERLEFMIPYPNGLKDLSALVIYSSGANTASENGYEDPFTLPMHATAGGQCLLAFSSESELRAFHGCELQALTASTLVDWERLDKRLPGIRERGYCACEGELADGVAEIAVPVHDTMHSLVGALAVSGKAQRIARLDRSRTVALLNKAARSIGKAM